MELKNDHEEKQPSSVFQGDEIFISRILAREVSKGQSSTSFYGAAEGVPFKWETNPGTPKHPQEEDQIFPLCPSPLMQSLGLPLPNLEDHEAKEPAFKTSIISSLRKLVKNNVIGDISKKVEKLGSWRCKQHGSSVFGDSKREFVGSAKDSSFSSNSSLSMFSSSSRVLDTPLVDDLFCCDPSHIHALLDEGNTRIYFCRHHKTAFTVEEDNSYLSRIKSRISASDQFSGHFHSEQTLAGIPFIWETQPGTPITPQEDEFIPPPSPPPALALPRHDGGDEAKDYNSTWKGVRFWRREKKESVEISGCGEEFESSFRRRSASASSGESWRVVKMNNLSCSPWSGTRLAVLAKKKFKSYLSY